MFEQTYLVATIVVLLLLLVIISFSKKEPKEKPLVQAGFGNDMENFKKKNNPDAGMQELATPGNTRVVGVPMDFTSDLWKTSYSHPQYDSVGRRYTKIDDGVVNENNRDPDVIAAAFPGTGTLRLSSIYEHL